MFHLTLRQAIAKAFPSRYNWLTWQKLLPEFVDVYLEAYLINRERYKKGQTLEKAAIAHELRDAATLLAKQQNHSYAYLALAHYLMKWELAAARKEAEHYKKQAEGYEQLAQDYKRLADQAIANLNENDNL